MTPAQYIRQNPDFKVLRVEQFRSSNGILTVIFIDGDKKISWNSIVTTAFRKHLREDSMEDFHVWLKGYMVKQINATPDFQEQVLTANIRWT